MLILFQVLPHEIAVVKLQTVGQMQREMGDWVYDDGDTADDAQGETAAQEPSTIVYAPEHLISLVLCSTLNNEYDML